MAPKTRRLRLAAAGTAALLAAGGFLVIEATSAEAGGATRYVATTGDDTDNDCTNIADPCRAIQYAVDQANANDTVSIGKGAFHESVHITKSLTVVGAASTGANKTTVDGESGDSGPSFWIDGTDTDSQPNVTLHNLDISNNDSNSGVLASEATLIVGDSVVSSNQFVGIDAEQGSTLTVHDSSVTNNEIGIQLNEEPTETKAAAPKVEGGNTADLTNDDISHNAEAGVAAEESDVTADNISVNRNGSGGFELTFGTATLDGSTFDGNAGLGVGVLGATLNLTGSTVSHTSKLIEGDEAGLGAGVLALEATEVVIDTSTLYGNTGQGVLAVASPITVKNSTIAGTRKEGASTVDVPDGAVVIADTSILPGSGPTADLVPSRARSRLKPQDELPASKVTLRGTLIGENLTASNCVGDMTDSGYNLSDDDTCSLTASTSIPEGTAKLGAFGSHGGSTDTVVPLKGSDAIDKIPSGKAGCAAGKSDQRGEDRLQGPKCDIGAVEVHQTPIVISPSSLPQGTLNVAYSATFTATGGLGAPYEFSLAPGSHLPPGLSLSTAGALTGTPTAAGTYTFTISVDDPTLKTYTLVIGGGTPPLADTGAKVSTLLTVGGGALALGVALMLVTGFAGRRREQ